MVKLGHKLTLYCISLWLCNVSPGNAFLGQLLNRVQKTLMTSWEQMRDQQIRPRRFAEMHLDGTPTFVQTVDGHNGHLELAISFLNNTSHEISLVRIPNIAKWVKEKSRYQLLKVATNKGWPTAIGRVANELTPDSETSYWWMTSSFYNTPPNVEGQIILAPIVSRNKSQLFAPVVISPETNGRYWYYSMVDWIDMNQDGWPDVVTSRSRGRAGSVQYSELIWLENPGYGWIWNNQRKWRSHTITHGPDISFQIMRIPMSSGESRLVIIGAGYWDNKLYAVWTEDANEDWSNVDAINERVIDNHGWFHDLKIADVNSDGRDDVVVTTWTYPTKQGSVYVYEIPCDFIHGQWRRHMLVDGSIDLPVPNYGSGGVATIFHPILRHNQESRKRKPFILVSGDDEGSLYVLIPNSRQTNDWSYSKHTIYKARGPVGSVTVEDLNHDGFMEIVVPVIDHKKLVYFTYEPGEIGPEYFVDDTKTFRRP